MEIINLVNSLLTNKSVIVPLVMVCAFEVECMREGVSCDGGSFNYVGREPVSQVYYLK